MIGKAWAAAVAAVLSVAMTTPAPAASLFEMLFWMPGPRYEGFPPPCDAGLAEVQWGFSSKESRFWNSALTIVGFEQVQEIAFMPWNRSATQAIPRRFCSAVAQVSDGVKRPVYYSIIENGGTMGLGMGVEWCVVGLDRNWAFNPGCRAARP
jgi:hypothetical protein